jgi:alkanesulfonate monooxygenase SsuD/methylene tetrahydromethanopterin reductase-like flavin-dependent oxidoreductase (luciferase family)
MAAATVDDLSGGRFVLGLGTSHREQVEPEHGVTFAEPTARLRDTVEIVRALLRDGVVSHAGRVIRIERFDLWFRPRRPALSIYVAGLFPRMLEICGEIADGVLLTWPTLEAAGQAAEHVARGAKAAGRSPGDVEIASLIPTAVAPSRAEALDRLRPVVAFYAGFFPRYNRLLAAGGFPDAVAAIKAAWDRGGRDAAAREVPDALVDAIALAGTPDECRDRLERYRRAGLALPIVSPRLAGVNPAGEAEAVIRALAPDRALEVHPPPG